jgi:hypothetical protein
MGMKRRMGISPEKIVGSQPKLEDILSLTTEDGEWSRKGGKEGKEDERK